MARNDPLVVYVHGIGAKPPKPDLKHDWDFALFGRDMGDATRMAYWADILHPDGPEAPSAMRISTRATGDAVVEGLRDAGVDPDDPAVQSFVAGLLGPTAGEVRTRRVGKKIVPLPGFLRRPIARVFLKALIGDSAAYFFRDDIRKSIRARVQAELPKDGRPVVLVTHSQGTIASYEVLSTKANAGLDVIEYVTLGSPLGIQEVQDLLDPGLGEIPTPPVDRWHNFADPIDPVAADKGLANDFTPNGFIVDDLMVNGNTRLGGDFNPHSAVGYLSHPKVRRVVNDAVREDPMARFVVARDVAQSLGTLPDVRTPVLVEVLEPGYGALDETQEKTRAFERKEKDGQPVTLAGRIARATRELERVVGRKHLEAARIDPLRRFVAAHLTADELRQVALKHREMRVYAVWRSSRKAKLLTRSPRVLKVDAARQSFGAMGQGITWAVLDTGIQGNHPHFARRKAGDRIVDVWDCTQVGPPKRLAPASAKDRDGHGTHVAGIIAGGKKDGPGGLAPEANLIVYKVLNDKGEGEDAWIIKALDHIATLNANRADGLAVHGLNLSLGGPFDATVYGCGFSPICQELRRLWRDGTLVVVACGNEGRLSVETADGEWDLNTPMSIGDPANLEECIAVGSVHADKPHLYGISYFSSRGPTADGRVKPDVVAPGERILSCNSRFGPGGKSEYYRESGTSMAAPHVSGLLAAFLSVRREFCGRPDEVKQHLLQGCTDLGRDRYHQGRGLPNLMKMLLDA